MARKHITVPDVTLRHIDTARGLASFSAWVNRAIYEKLERDQGGALEKVPGRVTTGPPLADSVDERPPAPSRMSRVPPISETWRR